MAVEERAAVHEQHRRARRPAVLRREQIEALPLARPVGDVAADVDAVFGEALQHRAEALDHRFDLLRAVDRPLAPVRGHQRAQVGGDLGEG